MSDTSADDKLLGFEYQFFYFLLKLLTIKKDETIGFEVKEDVHSEINKVLTLFQLKHTIQTNVKNEPINLTVADSDLWKTLSLWVDIIKKKKNKIEFLTNTRFIFVSNKTYTTNNKFLDTFNSFIKDGNFTNLDKFLSNYQTSLETKYTEKLILDKKVIEDKKISYLKNINSLDKDIKKSFFSHITFNLGLNNIILEIKDTLKHLKSIKESKIDNLFIKLTGLLKEDFLNKVKNRKSVQYTSEEFYIKTIPYFTEATSERLPFQELESYSKTKSIENMFFAKQLSDINISKEEIYDSDYNRVLIETNLKKLYQDGEITDLDIKKFEENAIEIWKDEFNLIYLEDEKTTTMAKKLFYKTIRNELKLAGQTLEWKKASKGQFISTSNIPLIGWKYTWEEDYKNEK